MFEPELYLSFAFVSFVLFLLEITGAALFMGDYAYIFLVMSMLFYVVHFVERFVVKRYCPHPNGFLDSTYVGGVSGLNVGDVNSVGQTTRVRNGMHNVAV